MIEGFYAVCEPPLTRRRFLKFAMVAGMVPALTSEVHAARDTDQEVRRFIERYAIGPNDPWASCTIRGVGRGCRLNGESAAGYVLRTCVRARKSTSDVISIFLPILKCTQHVSQDLPRGGRPRPRCSRATVASFS